MIRLTLRHMARAALASVRRTGRSNIVAVSFLAFAGVLALNGMSAPAVIWLGAAISTYFWLAD